MERVRPECGFSVDERVGPAVSVRPGAAQQTSDLDRRVGSRDGEGLGKRGRDSSAVSASRDRSGYVP